MIDMARGWESKAVEDQIRAAEEKKETQRRGAVTPAERERQNRRAGLLLSRAKIAADLDAARDERHRGMLRQALEYIDGQINQLEEGH